MLVYNSLRRAADPGMGWGYGGGAGYPLGVPPAYPHPILDCHVTQNLVSAL